MPLILETLQTTVKDKLLGIPELSGVPVIARNESDAQARIDETVQSGIGLAVVVDYPLPTAIDPNTSGPVFTEVLVQIEIIENVYTSAAAITALAAAEVIASTLHLWKPRLDNWHSRLVQKSSQPWKKQNDKSRLTIVQNYQASGAL